MQPRIAGQARLSQVAMFGHYNFALGLSSTAASKLRRLVSIVVTAACVTAADAADASERIIMQELEACKAAGLDVNLVSGSASGGLERPVTRSFALGSGLNVIWFMSVGHLGHLPGQASS